MSFLGLMQFLEDRLGHHQVPLNLHATTPAALLSSCALHHDLTKDIAATIYKANACRKLHDRIDAEKTLAALAPIRLKVIKSPQTDIDTFEFIESLCATVDAYFHLSAVPPAPNERSPANAGRIVQFRRASRTRTQRAS